MDVGVIDKSYVWSFAARFSHIVLILCLLVLFLPTSLQVHISAGVLFCLALILRICWGIFGTKHSKFSDFNFRGICAYLKTHEKFLGHNPASSIAIVIMLFLGLICVSSGFLSFGADKGGGIFAPLFYKYSNFSFASNLHSLSAYLLLCIAIIHTLGALLDKFYYKNDSIDSMISGYKNGFYEKINFSFFHKAFGIFWIIALILLFAYLLKPQNTFYKFDGEDYAKMNVNFAKECASCHTLYPPFLLNANSWQNMMDNLEDHFGDDASVSDKLNDEISTFLRANAADKKDNKFALSMRAYQGFEISASSFWKEAHAKVEQSKFKDEKVKSKSNCLACHENIEKGIFQ